MNEQLFDAMLRTALEEALEEDCREAPAEQKHTGHTSLRQRRRMRRMLADPWGYERRSREAKQMEAHQTMQVKTPVRHLRWPVLAAAVLLLTVSVTGYALRGGAFFQSFFEKIPWAEDYAGTADTEQLTELGGTGIGAVAEDEHLRLELLDAISEGENALAAVRVTVRDTELLEKYGLERLAFLNIEGSFFASGSGSGRMKARNGVPAAGGPSSSSSPYSMPCMASSWTGMPGTERGIFVSAPEDVLPVMEPSRLTTSSFRSAWPGGSGAMRRSCSR